MKLETANSCNYFAAKANNSQFTATMIALVVMLAAIFPTLCSAKAIPYKTRPPIRAPRAQFTFSPAIIDSGKRVPINRIRGKNSVIPPVAVFSFSPENPVVGETVNFGDSSTGLPNTYLWNFGDGATSNEKNPSHDYGKSGSYKVRLTVGNSAGKSSIEKTIAVSSADQVVTGSYKMVETSQISCFDNSTPISFPVFGAEFYGQDAQHMGNGASYSLSSDGKTVLDNITNLTWMRGPNTSLLAPVAADKMTYDEAISWVSDVNAEAYGGYSDWRIPTIKELYSLMNFNGTDPSSYSGNDTSVLTPFIDGKYFNFGYGQTSANERIIDSQYLSASTFVLNPAELGCAKQFGLNLADGRIKGYDLEMPGPQGTKEKTFFVQLVRGNPYGMNTFVNNGDGTISDQATGLMWAQDDSGEGMTWQEALSYVQEMNAQNHLGFSDWRLPDAKELHSIVNYENAPDFNDKPAIDTDFFNTTEITNENGEADYPYFWTSTSHIGYTPFGGMSSSAVYIAFGRALGYSTRLGKWIDVHGAGAQRSDPKIAPPYSYATTYTVINNGESFKGYAFGPQKDAIRGLNFVRLVR